MGISDKIADAVDKVSDKLGGDDKLKEHVDKAGDAVDNATGGKAEGMVDKAQDAAKDIIDK
ncbi:MAG: antitoxin [Hamadaea sp.]|nr:antitoxin [Hamadaea sp.]